MIFGKHINRYYIKYGPMLLMGLAALIAVDYFQLKVPEFYRMIVNGLNGRQVLLDGVPVPFDRELLFRHICLPMIGIILIIVTGRFLWRIGFFGSAIRMETDLRCRMFDHSKDLSQSYYQVNKVGNLMSLYTNDLETLQECFGDGVLMFFDALFLGVMAMVKMWRMTPSMTLLALIPMAILLLMGSVMRRQIEDTWEKRQAAFSSLSDFAQENYSGIAVVKAFVREYHELQNFRKLNRENEEINVKYTRISVLLNILVTLFVQSVVCVILGFGGFLVYRGQFDAGMLVEYLGYFTSVVWPIMAVSMLIEKTSRGRASLARVSELLDAPVEVADRPGVEELPAVRGGIEFSNLTFRYPGGEYDVLRDVSFSIEPGENVGIVGRTGAGKTTLMDLLLRLYNVPDGTLFVDGKDVNHVSIASLRRGCAYVPQDNFLFSDTIAHNIAFAVDEAGEGAVEEAARLSDVHDNIAAFQEGYQTVLGERGVTVSGGQKQRISIARALLKEAPILILDDAVSAVDTRTEKVILDNLRRTRKGRTTILIAHRISTIENMDKLIFLDDGEVRAVGTHEALYASCGDYRKMVELQRLEDEEGRGEER